MSMNSNQDSDHELITEILWKRIFCVAGNYAVTHYHWLFRILSLQYTKKDIIKNCVGLWFFYLAAKWCESLSEGK